MCCVVTLPSQSIATRFAKPSDEDMFSGVICACKNGGMKYIIVMFI